MRESYLLFFVININLGLGEDLHRPGTPGRTTGTVTPKRSPKKSPMGAVKLGASALVEKKTAPPKKKKKSPKIGLPDNRDVFTNLECDPKKIFGFESISEWGVNVNLKNELKDGSLFIQILQNQNSKPVFRGALWSWYWTREELDGYSTNGFIPYPVVRNPVQITLTNRKYQLVENDRRHLFRITIIEESGFEETVVLDDLHWKNSTSDRIQLQLCLIDTKGNSLNAEVIDLKRIEGKAVCTESVCPNSFGLSNFRFGAR